MHYILTIILVWLLLGYLNAVMINRSDEDWILDDSSMAPIVWIFSPLVFVIAVTIGTGRTIDKLVRSKFPNAKKRWWLL